MVSAVISNIFVILYRWATMYLQFFSTLLYGFCVPWMVLSLFLDPDSAFPTLSLYITNIINLYPNGKPVKGNF